MVSVPGSIHKTSLILLVAALEALQAQYKPFHGVSWVCNWGLISRVHCEKQVRTFLLLSKQCSRWSPIDVRSRENVRLKVLCITLKFSSELPSMNMRTRSRKSCIIHNNVDFTPLLENVIQCILDTFVACYIKRNLFNSLIANICNGFDLPWSCIDFASLTSKFFTPFWKCDKLLCMLWFAYNVRRRTENIQFHQLNKWWQERCEAFMVVLEQKHC